ncbi:MAG TPA: SGNH/GDSL hydrolase family protein [Pyrinomonadaceae bacterium]|nr:SGNH/GDSL hydrolase family protein [Pyrinomonadaceae bacterium]
MKHVVLLGDSVFDNAAYVGGAPDVVAHLRRHAPEGWKATLLAVDGSVAEDVRRQTRAVPADATHLVVSVGGNDALRRSGILEEPAGSVAEALLKLADAADDFRRGYREMLKSVASASLPAAVCTVYYPRFTDALFQRLAVAALAVFNDVITLEAFAAGLPLLDLRLICDEDSDYANPIEPSDSGGEKIARAVVRLVEQHSFEGRTEVFR